MGQYPLRIQVAQITPVICAHYLRHREEQPAHRAGGLRYGLGAHEAEVTKTDILIVIMLAILIGLVILGRVALALGYYPVSRHMIG